MEIDNIKQDLKEIIEDCESIEELMFNLRTASSLIIAIYGDIKRLEEETEEQLKSIG